MKRDMPKLGQILYDKAIGNAARRGEEPRISEVEVVNVGRTLFTCRVVGSRPGTCETIFRNDSRLGWVKKTEYCQDHKLYGSRQEILDEAEASELHDIIKDKAFYSRSPRMSLSALKQIKAILDSEGVSP